MAANAQDPAPVVFLQGSLKVLIHVRKDRPQVLQDFLRKDQPPIFRHKGVFRNSGSAA